MFELAIADGLARLTLRRPGARNAVPLAGWAELEARLGEVTEADARALILLGEGQAFCAGADLTDFEALSADAALRSRFRTEMRRALDALLGLDLPTLAAVDGPCYGAGVALAMACDVRIASARARFAITPAKLGISYPQEDVHRLVSLVGSGQAARLLLSAQSIDAAEAAQIGLVDILSDGGAAEEAETLAQAILAGSPVSHATLKRGIRLAATGLRSDEGQDRDFDDLIAGAEMLGRLAAVRGRR